MILCEPEADVAAVNVVAKPKANSRASTIMPPDLLLVRMRDDRESSRALIICWPQIHYKLQLHGGSAG